MKAQNSIFKMILAALFFALAYMLPFLTGQIPKIGSMLCPMHLPVLLCGFICGWTWGLTVGALVPLIRSLTLGMPIFFPMAVCMALELATYGVVAGLMYKAFPRKNLFIYCSLITAMIAGRFVWGTAMFVCMATKGGSFTFSAFAAGAFVNAIPGIVAQIVLVPVLVMVAERLNVLRTRE